MPLTPQPPKSDGNHKIIQVPQDSHNGGGQRTHIITMQGHEIILLDEPSGLNKIQITTSNGELQIRLDESTKTLFIGAYGENKLVIESDGPLSAKSRAVIDVDAPIINLNCGDTENAAGISETLIPKTPENNPLDPKS